MRCTFVSRLRQLAAGASFGVACLSSAAIAQDADTGAKPSKVATASSADDKDRAEEAKEEDPFAVPADASVEQLQAFIKKIKAIRPKGRTFQDVVKHYKMLAPAVVAAADQIIADGDEAAELAAINEKFGALGAAGRYDPAMRGDLTKLAEELAKDERDEVAVLGSSHVLTAKAGSLRGASAEDATEMAAEVIALLDRFGMNRSTYGAASTIARALGSGKNTEIGAELYESLASYMEKSDDENLSGRAPTMIGAARRMRLPGNSMEVFGDTADGSEFQWDDYKGKVVLVDFWASWCGPCLGELPSMKKNLAKYGERGFEIVGINMDSTEKAFSKCVEDKEITWTNIVSTDEDALGWKAPMATHYGITGIPTAILVDQDGKVVSLSARGKTLDKLLEELLGEEEGRVSEAEESQEEEVPGDG